jgi:hypothetical protein
VDDKFPVIACQALAMISLNSEKRPFPGTAIMRYIPK